MPKKRCSIKLSCVFLLICISYSNCDNNFFVTNKYHTSDYKCITNSSFAVSWIDENAEEPFEPAARFIPPSPPSNFDCDITDDFKTRNFFANRHWSLKRSLESNIREIIVDRRWESFRTIKTKFTQYSEKLKFEPYPIPLVKNDFEIPLSVRTEGEAHIFLCDGPYPPDANCYWFMLEGFDHQASAIRKCGVGFIPSIEVLEPQKPCKTPLAKIKHPNEAMYLLYDDRWSKFKVIKSGNRLSLVETDENSKKTILEATDKEKVIAVTHLVLHSKEEDALWKVHDLSEDATVITTKATIIGDSKFQVVPLTHDFEIPISIRTEKEGHIFLCDGAYPPEANCYWMMLQAFKGDASAIRKCRKWDIPSITNIYPTEPCKTPVHLNEHDDFDSFYLSNKYWNHFKVAKKNNVISFTAFEGNKTILRWADPEPAFNVTHLIFNSRLVNGLWKIHDVDFLYTNEIINKVPLGPPISPINGTICISMFASLCRRCVLMLTLSEQGRILVNESIYWPLNTPWREIGVLVDNIQGREFILSVSTSGDSPDQFWAIDMVRQCRKQEFRMISATKKADCQLLSEDYNVISFENTRLTTVPISCPENTIGELCVPCNLVYPDCRRINICSKHQSGGEICFCSAGYEAYNECYYECSRGNYGHGCQKKCGSKCVGACDHIDGTCKSCRDNYTGSKCEILKATYFEKAPEIIDVDFTRATIRIFNFDVQYIEEDDQPFSYSIQYKKAEPKILPWLTVSPYYNRFYLAKTFQLQPLQADTKYLVRGVVTTNRNRTYMGDQIPVAAFTTKCEEVSERIIYVRPSNTSVNVSLLRTSEATCRLNRYEIYIFTIGSPKSYDENNIYFDKLTPFTNYTIVFQGEINRFEKQFQTLEGIPQRVQNLTVTRRSPTSFRLQWEPPVALYGKLQSYTIEYQHIAHLACKTQSIKGSPTIKTAVEPSITISDLIPHSQYSFTIYAVNTRSNKGVAQTISTFTLPSKEIRPEEIPKIEQITPLVRAATVQFSRVNCQTFEGPVLMSVTPNCTSKWCNPPITINYPIPPISELLLGGLSPYTEYDLELKFCRNETVCSKDIVRQKFRTNPTAAQPVTDLVAYSTDETSISLRWKPPFPPTGEITAYKIIFFYYDRGSKKANYQLFSKTPCRIWPDSHCAKLTSLNKKTEYTIEVYVRNAKPSNYSEPAVIKAVTRKAPSEAPNDLTANWTAENDLELTWKHPNRSNGLIQFFEIRLNPLLLPVGKSKPKLLYVTEETYNLTYHQKVNSTDIQPATPYQIIVSAYNGQPGIEASIIDTSPPELPQLVDDADLSSTERTITVNFTIEEPRESIDYDYGLVLFVSDIRAGPIFRFAQFSQTEAKTALRVVADCKKLSFKKEYSIIIGNRKQLVFCNKKIKNPPLLPGSSYNVTLQLVNRFQDKNRTNEYSYIQDTTGGRQVVNYNVYNFNFNLFKAF